MLNYFYSDTIQNFLNKSEIEIIGELSRNSRGNIDNQLFAWENQIQILKKNLNSLEGALYFEFSIPRMGKRVDCIIIIKNIVFVIEFKVGQKSIVVQDIDQVIDYALDLKNFHKPSHKEYLAPILVATHSDNKGIEPHINIHKDNLLDPIICNQENFRENILNVLMKIGNSNIINPNEYIKGSYSPTPSIIEAAISLYNNHNVEEITKHDSDAINLSKTTGFISETIDFAKTNNKKVICFVTGVPGAGKTLVGLKVATDHLDKEKGNTSVFLSGNKPLVDILQEALVRDKVAQGKIAQRKVTKKEARESVKAFIQIIHHYRDAYLSDPTAPYDHVAIFDEAQRAWNKEQTVKFMHQKKGKPGFEYSEPEFLISCLDRHKDWAVIICLVGGGQEINTGEGGITEWLNAIKNKFQNWETRISPNLYESEYAAKDSLIELQKTGTVIFNNDLHLSVSMRTFRADKLSKLIKEILDIDENAKETLKALQTNYPIILTRDLDRAKNWLKNQARGSERYGMVVSSQAYRLKPLAINVNTPINHVHWFLNGKDDVRSSFFLEDVATEFQVQGLELDWACLTWDGDLRYTKNGWKTYSFLGNKWQNIHKESRKKYLINAYRVLLTRARQGMIIVVPEGNANDHTRQPEFYNSTYNYLKGLGFKTI